MTSYGINWVKFKVSVRVAVKPVLANESV